MLKQIPNAVTLSRVLFIPVIACCLFSADDHRGEGYALAAFLLTALAASTDWVDGYLARKYNWITNFGKIADAFVDKLLVVGLYVILLVEGTLPAWGWIIVVITVFRDVMVTWLRALAARKGNYLAAGSGGKWKTAVQLVAVVLLFAGPAFLIDLSVMWESMRQLLLNLGKSLYIIGIVLFILAGFLTLTSGWQYFRAYLPMLKEQTGDTASS